ncbi:MAG: hypothetical protein ABI841_06255 [Chloroflexota bacterium]
MDRSATANVPHVDASLDPIRAAISLVADGHVRRVTIHTPAAVQVMPAARQLARAAGVKVELVGADEVSTDVVVLPLAQQGA